MRSGYVRACRAAGRLAQRCGITDRLEQRPGRGALYIRSLFAIYDLDAMLRLNTPWWTFRAIERVDLFLAERGQARVFEFGSGASTVWLSARAAEVHTVEHDADFAARVLGPARRAGATVYVVSPAPSESPEVPSLRHGHRTLDFGEYVATITRVGGTFDLIVIDGRARVSALSRAIGHLAADGMIVFDDAARWRYRQGLAASGLHVERTFGLTPGLPYPSCTALIRRRRGNRDAH